MDKEKLRDFIQKKYLEAEKQYNREDINIIKAMLYQGSMYGYSEILTYLDSNE